MSKSRSSNGGFSRAIAEAGEVAETRAGEVLKAQQERRRVGASASVRQRDGSVSGSVRWRLQVLECQEVPPDNPEVVCGLALLRSSAGGFQGDRGVVFPQSSFLSRRHEGRVAEQGVQNHSTSCLFLQRFVESERGFLNSLY